VVQNSCDLSEQRANPLGTAGDLDVQQLLHGQREALLVGHHADIVQAIKVRQRLQVCLVLNQLFRTAVQQSHVWVRADNLFSIQLEDKTQHTVGGWVLRSKVDGVVADLPLTGVCGGRVGCARGGVDGLAEGRVDGDETSGVRVGGLDGGGHPPRWGSREASQLLLYAERGCGDGALRAEADSLGAIARQTGKRGGHGGRAVLMVDSGEVSGEEEEGRCCLWCRRLRVAHTAAMGICQRGRR